MRDVVRDVITNTSITKSTGNAESQVIPRPAGNAGSDTARDRVKDMADTIPDILTVVKDLQDVKYILVILV